MKKSLTLVFFLFITGLLNAQIWVGSTSTQPLPAVVSFISGNIQSSNLQLKTGGYTSQTVQTPNGPAQVISVDEATPILIAGDPDLPKVTASLIIPDNAHMGIQITNSDFVEYQNIEIAPSKGNFTRDIDPASVPYTYGVTYSQNQFYPGKLAELRDPYILRDLRGQTVIFYPYQYNPVTKVLRVYTNLEVSIAQDGLSDLNVMTRTKAITGFDREFAQIYKQHFINYNNTYKYTPIEEQGNMLIICYSTFMSAMQPFVDWKNTEGIHTEMIDKATAGATAAAIKTYVTNYYNTNGLTFLLLVGDAAQIPTFTVSGGGSDPSYGYITGSDHYQEIIVGRFSAESVANVQTQVTRSINYEKTPSTTPGKFNRTIAIGSDQGPGDDNEYDYQHERNLQTQMTGFTYTSRVELFDGSQGGLDASGNPTATMLGNEINSGAGIITYTGHGSDNSFGTTGYSNSNMSTLTNTSILPFIWSVACVNGNFTGGTCFAEGWLRQTYNGQPVGAVAALMSTINQSWNPPMEGQDEMVNILTENAGANIKRTFGGLSVNGIFQMNDATPDFNMTDTWTIFGDPSLMVRTDDPVAMAVTHVSSIDEAVTNLVVNCSAEGALVCLTVNHLIIGTGTVTGGVANISFPTQSQGDTITVCATAFNYIPYLGTVLVTNTTNIQEQADNSTGLICSPNPTNGIVNVNFTLNESSNISLKLVDITGREIAELDNESNKPAGSYKLLINTDDFNAGLYYIVLHSNNLLNTAKIIITK
jgi:hypothetical protein